MCVLSLGVMMQLCRFNILEAAIFHSRSHFFLYISVDLKCFCPAVSGQQCKVAQTLGKPETAVRIQVSQPPLPPVLSGLRDLMGISSALPKLQFSPFAPLFTVNPMC